MNDYAKAILKLRVKLDISQTELGKMLNVSYASANRWEKGHFEPTVLVKERLKILFKEITNTVLLNTVLLNKIESILIEARKKVSSQINTTLLTTYMEIGRLIVEDELIHNDDTNYVNKSIRELSKILTNKYGKGFSKSNIFNMISFYKEYKTVQSLTGQLSWTHYRSKKKGIISNQHNSSYDLYGNR